MTASDHADDGITSINVTPLVDITLVLLIIFMVTARILTAQAMPVTLPNIASPTVQQSVLAVGLSAEGQITVAGQAIGSDDELLGQAQRERAAHPDVRVVLQADATARHGRVVHVMDILHQAKIEHIAFGVVKSTPAR